MIELQRPPSGAFDQRGSGCNIPFIFRNEREGKIGATGRDQPKFVGHRSHGTDLELRGFELLPFSAVYFATAGEHKSAVQVFPLAWLCWLAVIGHTIFARSEDEFVGCWIADASGDRNSVLNHGDRNAEFADALHELARAVERIDPPDALFIEASEIVDGFFREPAFSGTKKSPAQDLVDGAVRLRDRIVSDLVFGFNCARSEAVEHGSRRFVGGGD